MYFVPVTKIEFPFRSVISSNNFKYEMHLNAKKEVKQGKCAEIEKG